MSDDKSLNEYDLPYLTDNDIVEFFANSENTLIDSQTITPIEIDNSDNNFNIPIENRSSNTNHHLNNNSFEDLLWEDLNDVLKNF